MNGKDFLEYFKLYKNNKLWKKQPCEYYGLILRYSNKKRFVYKIVKGLLKYTDDCILYNVNITIKILINESILWYDNNPDFHIIIKSKKKYKKNIKRKLIKKVKKYYIIKK
jgi:hypothetical protein